MGNSDILTFQKNDLIFRKGDPATRAFMVLTGSVRVFLEEDTKIIDLATLGTHEIFGETALFDGEVYGASVSAFEDCAVQVIPPDFLNIALEKADPTLRAILEMLIRRLKSTNEALLKSESRSFVDLAFI